MKPRAWVCAGKVYDYKPTDLSDDDMIPLYIIPVDWKLVPVYPTDMMVQQGVIVTENNDSETSIETTIRNVIYEAIKAAPDEPSRDLDFNQ